jgi:hypothetical protein
MKIKPLIVAILMTGFLNACISNNISWTTNERIKNVEIGMGKDEVIRILGNRYMITSSSKDYLGNSVEVLGYKSDFSEEYKLRFVNDTLTEWNREHVPRYIEAPSK